MESLVELGMQAGLGQFRAFVTVAATRNFTRAAQVLGLSQPALTTRIQQFEDILGLKLFERSAKGVELTHAGSELLPHFKKLLNEFEFAIADAKSLASGARGAIRIACLPSCAATLLPEWIVHYRKEGGMASITVRDAVNSRIGAMVRDNEVDFGIAVAEANPFGLQTTPLMQDRLHVAIPLGHALGEEGHVTLAQIADRPLILMAKGSSVREIVDAGFSSAGLAPRPVCETTYMSTAVAMVKAGLGVAILPSTAIELRSEGIQSRPIEDDAFTREIVLLRRSDGTLSSAAESFIKIIAQSAALSVES
jgi:DNA-binding transcriptional LysR family regulator